MESMGDDGVVAPQSSSLSGTGDEKSNGSAVCRQENANETEAKAKSGESKNDPKVTPEKVDLNGVHSHPTPEVSTTPSTVSNGHHQEVDKCEAKTLTDSPEEKVIHVNGDLKVEEEEEYHQVATLAPTLVDVVVTNGHHQLPSPDTQLNLIQTETAIDYEQSKTPESEMRKEEEEEESLKQEKAPLIPESKEDEIIGDSKQFRGCEFVEELASNLPKFEVFPSVGEAESTFKVVEKDVKSPQASRSPEAFEAPALSPPQEEPKKVEEAVISEGNRVVRDTSISPHPLAVHSQNEESEPEPQQQPPVHSAEKVQPSLVSTDRDLPVESLIMSPKNEKEALVMSEKQGAHVEPKEELKVLVKSAGDKSNVSVDEIVVGESQTVRDAVEESRSQVEVLEVQGEMSPPSSTELASHTAIAEVVPVLVKEKEVKTGKDEHPVECSAVEVVEVEDKTSTSSSAELLTHTAIAEKVATVVEKEDVKSVKDEHPIECRSTDELVDVEGKTSHTSSSTELPSHTAAVPDKMAKDEHPVECPSVDEADLKDEKRSLDVVIDEKPSSKNEEEELEQVEVVETGKKLENDIHQEDQQPPVVADDVAKGDETLPEILQSVPSSTPTIELEPSEQKPKVLPDVLLLEQNKEEEELVVEQVPLLSKIDQTESAHSVVVEEVETEIKSCQVKQESDPRIKVEPVIEKEIIVINDSRAEIMEEEETSLEFQTSTNKLNADNFLKTDEAKKEEEEEVEVGGGGGGEQLIDSSVVMATREMAAKMVVDEETVDVDKSIEMKDEVGELGATVVGKKDEGEQLKVVEDEARAEKKDQEKIVFNTEFQTSFSHEISVTVAEQEKQEEIEETPSKCSWDDIRMKDDQIQVTATSLHQQMEPEQLTQIEETPEVVVTQQQNKDGDHDSGVDESTQGKDGTEESSSSPAKKPTTLSEAPISAKAPPPPTPRSSATPKKSPSAPPPVSASPARAPKAPSSTSSQGSTTQEQKKLPMNKIVVGTSPSPNLKVVKSKIGSLENAHHKAGGGNVKLETKKINITGVKSKIGSTDNIQHKPAGGDKKILSRKLEWKGQSKVGSLDNTTHKPGGGAKKIETVKINFKDTAKSKVGSRDNIQHKAGGGQLQIEDHKLSFKDSAKSKVGSMDYVSHKAGGGNVQIFDEKLYYSHPSGEKNDKSNTNSPSPTPCKTSSGVEGGSTENGIAKSPVSVESSQN